MHELGHFLVVTCKDMKRDKFDDKMVVRQVVVKAGSKEVRDCMVKDLVVQDNEMTVDLKKKKIDCEMYSSLSGARR